MKFVWFETFYCSEKKTFACYNEILGRILRDLWYNESEITYNIKNYVNTSL